MSRMLEIVDFPEPIYPTTAMDSPGKMSNEMPYRASKLP